MQPNAVGKLPITFSHQPENPESFHYNQHWSLEDQYRKAKLVFVSELRNILRKLIVEWRSLLSDDGEDWWSNKWKAMTINSVSEFDHSK